MRELTGGPGGPGGPRGPIIPWKPEPDEIIRRSMPKETREGLKGEGKRHQPWVQGQDQELLRHHTEQQSSGGQKTASLLSIVTQIPGSKRRGYASKQPKSFVPLLADVHFTILIGF